MFIINFCYDDCLYKNVYQVDDLPSSVDRLRELKEKEAAAMLKQVEDYLHASPPESPPARKRMDTSPSRVRIPASVRTSSPIGRASSPVRRPRSPSPVRSRFSPRRSLSPTKVAQNILDGRGLYSKMFSLYVNIL